MKRSIALALLIVTGVTMSGCSSPDNATPTADPTSTSDNNIVVIQDWVDVGYRDFIKKACDGTTLLYLTAGGYGSSGIAAIPNSPECEAVAATEEPPPAE